MRSFIVFCALFAFALAGPGWNKDDKKHHKHHFEVKCGDQKIEFDDSIKKVNDECDTKIFGDMKKMFEEKKKDAKDTKDVKREKPTPEMIKEMKAKWAETFEKNIKPKIGCAAVCKAKGLNLINADGKVNKENYTKMVQKLIKNQDLVTKILAESEKCYNAHPVLYKEDSCTKDNDAIFEALKCVGEATKTVCGVKDEETNDVDSTEDN